jgi:putative ABC transport system permease protein
MKFLELVIRNMTRRMRRTVLTILVIAVATLLFAMLMAVPSSIDEIVASASRGQRLYITNRAGPYNMPAKYCIDVRKMKHVMACAAEWDVWFRYRSDTDWIGVVASDPEILDTLPPSFSTPEDVARFRREKRSAAVGYEAIKRYGWQPGQQIMLRGEFNDAHVEMPLIIQGVIPDKTYPNAFVMRRDYLNDTLKAAGQGNLEGLASRLVVRVDTVDNMGQVGRLIDETYHNSDTETRSQTESDFLATGLANIGNIRAIILSLVAVVLITVLLIAGNSMAMTVRERIPELALLRTLGFGQVRIGYLLFTEALLLGVAGGLLGAGGALLLFAGGIDLSTITNGLGLIAITPAVATLSLITAITVSVLSGTLPITGALRIAPAIALRKVV